MQFRNLILIFSCSKYIRNNFEFRIKIILNLYCQVCSAYWLQTVIITGRYGPKGVSFKFLKTELKTELRTHKNTQQIITFHDLQTIMRSYDEISMFQISMCNCLPLSSSSKLVVALEKIENPQGNPISYGKL